ncbi:MAG TPA: protein kinase [Ktedonobacteraceae bacterium]
MALEELQNGRYRYLRLLGGGGMGEVYLMQDTRVNRRVAIKVLRAESSLYADDEKTASSARLFEREARAIAALDHPNILPLYDFGEEVREDQTMTYMVMPYCADGSLESWLRQRSGELLLPQQVAALIEQAAEGLQYAHEHKVIHLDVKPPNFLIRGNRKDPLRPTLLLADFGIARNFTTVASSSRTIRGTPASMAPEQWSGEPVFASDQYALAVMTYEMLVGRPPFTGTLEQLMYRHFSVQSPPPSTFNQRLPAALDAVLLRALSKKPEERFPSIADFASALVEAASQPAADPEPVEPEPELASYATLALNQAEADAGINRLVKLESGEEITVSVPAGARHGQVLRLPGPAAVERGGVVLVNIAIQQPKELRSAQPVRAEPILVTPLLEAPAPEGRAVQAPEAPLPQQHPRPEVGLELGPEHDLPTLISQGSRKQVIEDPAPEHDLPTFISQGDLKQITEVPRPAAVPRYSRQRLSLLALISLFVVLLLAGGSIYAFAIRQSPGSRLQITPTRVVQQGSTPAASATRAFTPTPGPGLNIAGKYNGSMAANGGGNYTPLSIVLTQNDGSGSLTGSATLNSFPQQSYQLQGTDDLQGKFTLIVQQPAGQLPLILYGGFQPGELLRGNYCHASAPPCKSPEGYFTVGPRF